MSSGKVSRGQHHPPLSAGLLCFGEMHNGFFHALGRRTGNYGILGKTGLGQAAADGADDSTALAGRQMHGFAGAAEEDKTGDTSASEEHRMLHLRVEIERRNSCRVVWVTLGEEKSRYLRVTVRVQPQK
jgi:hypothetical protein